MQCGGHPQLTPRGAEALAYLLVIPSLLYCTSTVWASHLNPLPEYEYDTNTSEPNVLLTTCLLAACSTHTDNDDNNNNNNQNISTNNIASSQQRTYAAAAIYGRSGAYSR